MKRFLKTVRIVFIIFLLFSTGCWLYLRTLHPVYKGVLNLENISEDVIVYFDAYGVPHINAKNQQDAYTALGYVHAQDRLWQMELIRRIAPGRLSEILGDQLVETDAFFAGLGLAKDADEAISKLDVNSQSYQLTMAYLDGVNQFVDQGATPVEFLILGINKTKFTINDVYHVFGYMSFSFAMAQITDPLLQEIKENLGGEYLNELGIDTNQSTPLSENEKRPIEEAVFASAMQKLYKQLPVALFTGSNAWIIGPEKTKNGKVIFANDPHIGFSQPSIWYQSHLKTPDYEMYGYNLALTPFPLLGHNRDYAYGLTMIENDDVDFYYEKNNPNNPNEYKTPEGFVRYRIVKKTLKIKDHPDTTFILKSSRHGPIVNNLTKGINDQRAISMQWTYKKMENKILDAGYGMSHATSVTDFVAAAEFLHAPGLNLMYGDAQNNIARVGAGKFYRYRDALNTKLFLDGASGEDEIVAYLDFKENPSEINPKSHYVYSANNQQDTIAGILYPGYYLPEDRARRIEELLSSKNDWTQEDVEKMIFDVISPTAPEIIANLVASLRVDDFTANQLRGLKILKDWDGNYQKKAIAPVIYNRFLYEFLKRTFSDELGESFSEFMKTHLMKRIIADQAEKSVSVWFDDLSTQLVETKFEIVQQSFKHAILFLESQLGDDVSSWHWDRVISLEHEHALAAGGELFRSLFNVGPFVVDGGNEVINNQIFTLNETGIYKVKVGPSTRRIIDFSDVESAVGILPTGQSGNIFSKHYRDQAQRYVNGKFIKMLLNSEVIEGSENVLVFRKS